MTWTCARSVDMTDGPVGRIAVAVADWPAEERGALGLTEGEEVTVTEAAAGGEDSRGRACW